jgi:hypothetical protein
MTEKMLNDIASFAVSAGDKVTESTAINTLKILKGDASPALGVLIIGNSAEGINKMKSRLVSMGIQESLISDSDSLPSQINPGTIYVDEYGKYAGKIHDDLYTITNYPGPMPRQTKKKISHRKRRLPWNNPRN